MPDSIDSPAGRQAEGDLEICWRSPGGCFGAFVGAPWGVLGVCSLPPAAALPPSPPQATARPPYRPPPAPPSQPAGRGSFFLILAPPFPGFLAPRIVPVSLLLRPGPWCAAPDSDSGSSFPTRVYRDSRIPDRPHAPISCFPDPGSRSLALDLCVWDGAWGPAFDTELTRRPGPPLPSLTTPPARARLEPQLARTEGAEQAAPG